MAINQTMSSVWDTLNLAGQNLAGANQQALSEAERLQKKKKLMSAGTADDFQNAVSTIFGSSMLRANNPMA